jgi:hypothetical protein
MFFDLKIMLLALISILALIFFAISSFLGREFLNKLGHLRDFTHHSNQMVVWRYEGDRRPGMYNIVLRGEKQFCTLIGFKLNIPIFKYSGFDYYGFAKSNENNVAVISTYLGRASREFQFFINMDIDNNFITATSSEEDQLLQPHLKFSPHWYQRFGFFA